jgi:hypothetical protein
MNQTGWDLPISQCIWVKIVLLKMVAGCNPFFYYKKHRFTSSTCPIQPDFSQNLPVAITLNTKSPRTLVRRTLSVSRRNSREESFGRTKRQTLIPPMNYGGCQIEAGAALLRNFCPHPGLFWTLIKNYCPPRPTSKKTLPLHSCIECTSPSRFQIQYICALPPSK